MKRNASHPRLPRSISESTLLVLNIRDSGSAKVNQSLGEDIDALPGGRLFLLECTPDEETLTKKLGVAPVG